jgi:predicted site-specific integrase-resolvase
VKTVEFARLVGKTPQTVSAWLRRGHIKGWRPYPGAAWIVADEEAEKVKESLLGEAQ